MADHGTIYIDLELKGKEKTISDAEQVNRTLEQVGAKAGDKMDDSLRDNVEKSKRTLSSFPKEVKTKLIAEAQDAGIKNFSSILAKIPKEKRVELLSKVEDGKAIDFKALIKSLPKDVQTKIKVKDEASTKVKDVQREQKKIPASKSITLKAKDEASGPISRVSATADKASEHVSHLKQIIVGSMVGNLLSNGLSLGFSKLSGFIGEAAQSAKEYSLEQQTMNATWLTLTGNAKEGQKMVDMTNQMAVAANNSTEMVDKLNQKFYSISNNADLTEHLTSSILTLQDAFGATDDAVENFGTQFSQMMANGKVSTQDMMSFVNVFPKLRVNLLDAERDITGNTKLTMAQMNDLMSAGKISSDTMEKVVEDTAKQYGSATKNFTSTIPGMARTIKSQMPILLSAFSQPMTTAANPIIGTMSGWVTSKETQNEFKTVGKTFSDGLNRTISAFAGSGKDSKTAVVDTLNGAVQGLNRSIDKTFSYVSDHAGDIKGITSDLFDITKIIGGTVWSVAYHTFVDIASAFGLVGKNGDKAKDPLDTIKDVLDKMVAHKTEIENLTKVWLAFFAVKKITGWISAINDARKSLLKFEAVQKLMGSSDGSTGFSLPSFGKSASKTTKAVTLGEDALKTGESVVTTGTTSTGVLSKIKGLFGKGSTSAAINGADDVVKSSGWLSKLGGGAAKAVGGGIAAVDIASSLTGLIGINKKNAGSRVGSVAGSLGGTWGGAAAGATIGTAIMPGIGTTVGGAIGAAVGSAAGTKYGKQIGADMQKGLQAAFHPKLSSAMDKTTNKLKGSTKSFVKDYQSNMNKITADTILMSSATDKEASKLNANMGKTYKTMSKNVDAYYKSKEAKSKKDLETLVNQGYMTQKQADKAMASEKKGDSERANNMKKSYKNMAAETARYYADRQKTTNSFEKRETAAVTKIERDRAKKRAALVKSGATKAELNAFDQKTAQSVEKKRQQYEEKKNKALLAQQKTFQKNMKTLQDQANTNTYKNLAINAGKEKDLLNKLARDKQKLSQKELEQVIKTSSKQTKAVVEDANDQYDKVKKAAEKKYKATTDAADKEYYVNHSISKAQHDKIVGDARDQRDQAVSSARDQRDKVVKQATSQHKEVVEQATKQAGEHRDAVNTETGKVKGVWDTFVDNVAGVWNSLIDAWNWIGKLWGKKETGHWKRYAIGTGGTQKDEFAVVGEEGFELGYHPHMGLFPLGVNGMTTAFLPKGTSILPHNQSKQFLEMTEGLPHHADGVFGTISDIFESVKKAASGVGSSIASAFGTAEKFISKGVSGAWDWVQDKTGISELTKNDGKAWASMRSDFGSGTLKSIKKEFNSLFSPLFDKAKKDEEESASGAGGNYDPSLIRKAAKEMGVDPSENFVKLLQATIQSESGGRNVIQQIHDVNSGGNEARGILQFTPPTFRTFAMKGHTNIMSPYDQLLAFFNNSDWQHSIGWTTIWGNRKVDWLHSGPHGHRRLANGGRFDSATPAIIGEDGTEFAVNITKPNADALLAAAIEERAKRGDSIFSGALHNMQIEQSNAGVTATVGSSYSNSKTAGIAANGTISREAIELLKGIRDKDWTVQQDGKTVAKVTEKYRSPESTRRQNLVGRGLAIDNRI